MKRRWILGSVAAVGLVLGVVAFGTAGDAVGGAGTVTATFAVEGMTCGGCETGVKLKVGLLAGVETVEASYEESRATVTYVPDRTTPEAIIEAIEELGYSAELVEPEAEGADPGAPARRSA